MTSHSWRVARPGRVIALVAAVMLGVSGWIGVARESDQTGRVVVAEFASASPLLEGSDVKVHGVKVGTITSIALEGNKALVAMKLEPTALPLHTDATARVRAVSLLGERYLDLDRGTGPAPVLSAGERIPVTRTAQNVDLDQVLNTVDQPTGEALSELVGALGDGLDGNGANAAALIRALGPAMHDTDGLVRILRDQNDLLGSVVDKVHPLAGALAADDGRRIDGLATSANNLTRVTAERHQQLESALAELPPTLTDARQVLGDLTGTAQQATPTLAALRPTTDNLTAISEELKGFSAAADPALASAEPVLDRAKTLLDEARPVTDALEEAGPQLRTVASNGRPVVAELAGNFDNVLNFLRYWALTTNGYDGISHYFRAHVTFDASMLAGHPLGPSMPVPPLNQPPPAPGQPQQPGLVPGLLGEQGAAPPGLLAPQSSPDGSATGLDQQQESNVLQYMLGGGQ